MNPRASSPYVPAVPNALSRAYQRRPQNPNHFRCTAKIRNEERALWSHYGKEHVRTGKNDDANNAALFVVHGIVPQARPRLFTLEETFGIMAQKHETYHGAARGDSCPHEGDSPVTSLPRLMRVTSARKLQSNKTTTTEEEDEIDSNSASGRVASPEALAPGKCRPVHPSSHPAWRPYGSPSYTTAAVSLKTPQ
ncbi:hypothetical protein PG996_007522 [Apiospora saccharicola]|uniref:Uncharacterized protein n=1 Tax=Apiospora saccharicola TaxID=335842 RepID=A0ABR1VB24_9PEZI